MAFNGAGREVQVCHDLAAAEAFVDEVVHLLLSAGQGMSLSRANI